MSRSYEIRLTTPGFDAAVKQLNSIGATSRRVESLFQRLVSSATGLDAVTKRFSALADQVERVQKAGAAVAGATGAGASGGSPRGAPGAKRTREFASGPNQQLAEAMEQLANAKAAGNPLAVRDAARSIRLKERSISLDDRRKGDPEHLTRPGLLELFSDLNNLMRNFRTGNAGAAAHTLDSLMRNQAGGINMQQMLSGGGLIGGRTGAGGAAGGSAMAARALALATNPVTLAAGGAVLGIVAMAGAARLAASALSAVRGAASAAGAGPGEVAALRAMGIDPGQVQGLGAGLRGKLSSDPYAQAIGGYALPSHLTGESDAKLVRAQLERLRGLHEEGRTLEMVRQARVLGMEAYLDELQVSGKFYRALQDDAKLAGRIFGDTGRTQAARDYDSALKRIGNQWENLKAVVGGPYVSKFAEVMRLTADAMRGAADAGDRLRPFFDLMTDVQFGGWAAAIAKMAFGAAGGSSGKSANNPVDRNTAALEKLAAVITDVVGGGARARGALTPAQRGAVQRGDQLNAARDLRAFRA